MDPWMLRCRDRREDGDSGEEKGRPPSGGGPRCWNARANTGPPGQPGHHQRFGIRRVLMAASLAGCRIRVNAVGRRRHGRCRARGRGGGVHGNGSTPPPWLRHRVHGRRSSPSGLEAGCPALRSGPAFETDEPAGQSKTSARPAGADEMTLVDGESAMKRAFDRAVDGTEEHRPVCGCAGRVEAPVPGPTRESRHAARVRAVLTQAGGAWTTGRTRDGLRARRASCRN